MAATTALLIVQWNLAALQPVIYVWSLFMAVSVAIIAHNHNHVPIWKSRFLKIATDYWLTLFYGFPAFGWIPTHNKNHHFLNNKKGDYTLTYRVSEKNNILTLLSYPSKAPKQGTGKRQDRTLAGCCATGFLDSLQSALAENNC